MVRGVARQAERRRTQVAAALDGMRALGTSWPRIDAVLEARQRGDHQETPPVRLSRPFLADELPLHAAHACPPPPFQAVILAVDGSQILPDRHAPFLYYLLHVGGLVYYHGLPQAPREFGAHELVFDEEALLEGGGFLVSGAAVGARRDAAEIEALAREAWAERDADAPRLALLDQRLLYRPVGQIATQERAAIVGRWQQAMIKIGDSGAALAGYIDRPRSQAVVSLLQMLGIGAPPEGPGLAGLLDADLFAELLAPGERSKLFVYVSKENDAYRERDAGNEVCFFYLNTGTTPDRPVIARIDLPRRVVDDPAAVDGAHALIIDQCRIWRDYPYVLTRADEVAVVGRQDQASLELMITNALARDGQQVTATAKQTGKDLARAGKTRHHL